MADEVLDLSTETVETEPVETEVEGAEPGAEVEAAEESVERGVADVWRDIKDRLKDAPDLHKQVKTALHTMEAIKKQLPDGISKAVERLEAINQLDDDPDDPEYVPGSRTMDEVISNTIAERTFWREFDTAFQAGDGRVINQMIEANPASFEKLIPDAMDRWAEMNPDGFSTYVCRSVDGYLQRAEIPLQMALLARVLPESSQDPGLQTVIDAFGAIKRVVEEIRTTAKNEITPKNALAATEPVQQAGNTADREMNLRHDEWMSPVRGRSNTLAATEAVKAAGKNKFTAQELDSIKKSISEEVNLRCRGNVSYQNRLKGFLKANNKAGFVATVESEHKKIIPSAAARAVAGILAKRSSAKAVMAKPAAKAAVSTEQTDERFEMISGPPRTLGLKVDFSRTNHTMMAKDQAYIVGRKNPVKWRRK